MTQVFEGITVLDFTSGQAGGVATMVLSDFGAEVIKVEPPRWGKVPGFPGIDPMESGQEKRRFGLEDSGRQG